MRYLSVCSGIEAATVSWHSLGWTPVAFSEIEPFPAAVLAHHYPDVPNYGDMTKHKEWPLESGSIDLLVGGTPCQSFSVAGLRKGLHDPRGGLMLTYIEIAQRLRPRWVVWENVPGVLSSNGGRDFGSFLGALGELGYGWAYRVLDAQWVRTQRHPRAVPQRRRRVFVVGCLVERGAGDRNPAAAVLFERESVCRDSAPRRAQGEGSAADVKGCSATVSSKWAKGTGGPAGDECYNLTTGYRGQNDRDGLVQDGTAPACRASASSSGFHEMNYPVVVARDNAAHAAVVNMQGSKSNACVSTDGSSFTLNAMHGHDVHAVVVGTDLYNCAITGDVAATMGTPGSSVNASGPTVMAFAQNQLGEVRTGDVSGTINTNSNASGRNTPMAAVAFPIDTQNMTEGHSSGGLGFGQHGDPSFTVTKGHSHAVSAVAFTPGNLARGAGPSPNAEVAPTQRCSAGRGADDQRTCVAQAMTVRRLTPRECERLQGFPDDYTLIPWRKKPAADCPDGPRYKALGNSMAVNCMAWIGERIAAIEAREQ